MIVVYATPFWETSPATHKPPPPPPPPPPPLPPPPTHKRRPELSESGPLANFFPSRHASSSSPTNTRPELSESGPMANVFPSMSYGNNNLPCQ